MTAAVILIYDYRNPVYVYIVVGDMLVYIVKLIPCVIIAITIIFY